MKYRYVRNICEDLCAIIMSEQMRDNQKLDKATCELAPANVYLYVM